MNDVKDDFECLIVIDANKYLDLYRRDTGLQILKYLSRVSEYIFVTSQLVNEVNRNKVKVLSDFLANKIKAVSIDNVKLPEHFGDGFSGDKSSLSEELGEIKNTVGRKAQQLKDYSRELLALTTKSEDEVSISLSSIFSRAVEANDDELERARLRKELGNPPGKKGPLGDELLWEQLLTKLRGKTKLWLITSDSDFATKHEKSLFLNAFLMQEIKALPNSPQIFVFDETLGGIRDFAEVNGIDLDIELSREEIDEINLEEQQLILSDRLRDYFQLYGTGIAGSVANQLAALEANPSFQSMLEAQKYWNSDILKTAAQMASLESNPSMRAFRESQSGLVGQAQKFAAEINKAGNGMLRNAKARQNNDSEDNQARDDSESSRSDSKE
ncbi:MAG: hypothetical protein COB00_10700 [Alcanivorax sp.]|nr:MAG: hypothetical protein COB00_10700 [Alcanivorax sp.]